MESNMGDLISRSVLIEALENEVKECEDCMIMPSAFSIISIARKQPTVEAEPVVHCKECKHWGTGVAGETDHVKCCEYGRYMVGMNGYCVYGAKMDR